MRFFKVDLIKTLKKPTQCGGFWCQTSSLLALINLLIISSNSEGIVT